MHFLLKQTQLGEGETNLSEWGEQCPHLPTLSLLLFPLFPSFLQSSASAWTVWAELTGLWLIPSQDAIQPRQHCILSKWCKGYQVHTVGAAHTTLYVEEGI